MSAIPLNIYVTPFVDEAAKWTCDKARETLDVVNKIWLKAKISFAINDCITDDPLDLEKKERTHDQVLLDALSERHKPDNFVHIYLVNRIPNLNAGGASYLDSYPQAASFVQRYDNAVGSGRAWAHELGHLLSLDHVDIDYSNERQAALLVNNLMTKGLAVGTELSADQISQAKASKLLKRFGG
jgi:hypothetical protein